jgi:hypothetical protein
MAPSSLGPLDRPRHDREVDGRFLSFPASGGIEGTADTRGGTELTRNKKKSAGDIAGEVVPGKKKSAGDIG